MREAMEASKIERARDLVNQAARDAGIRGFAAVAERVDLKRSAVSMFARRKYPAGESGVARKVLAALDGFPCSYTQERITLEQCRATALGDAPTHNPLRLTHWQVCLNCPGRPQATTTKES